MNILLSLALNLWMMFYLLVNSYGNFKMVSSPNHIFLDKFDYAAYQ